jgi:hypothetical protein
LIAFRPLRRASSSRSIRRTPSDQSMEAVAVDQ